MTTKKNLQEQVRVLQKELSSFKAEQKKTKRKASLCSVPRT